MNKSWLPTLLLAASAAFGADPSLLQFQNDTYELARVTASPDGSVLNEYVKAGESMENWTTMVSVRHAPSAAGIGGAINPWLQSVRNILAKKWNATRTPNARSDNDAIIEAWIAPADSTYCQATLQRFVVEDGTPGVKMYAFVERIILSDQAAVSEFNAKRYSRQEALGAMKAEVVPPKP